MTISVTLDGADELIAQLAKIGKQSGPAMTKIANATAIELRGNIIKKISGGPKTGAIYYYIFDPETGYTTTFAGDTEGFVRAEKGNSSRPSHQSSAAGEAPASDLGGLVGSIYFDNAKGSFGAPVATVGSKLAYAYWLEYGTLRMKARPVWEPEAKKAQGKFIKRVENYLSKVTR